MYNGQTMTITHNDGLSLVSLTVAWCTSSPGAARMRRNLDSRFGWSLSATAALSLLLLLLLQRPLHAVTGPYSPSTSALDQNFCRA
jgi:hypothetical protein